RLPAHTERSTMLNPSSALRSEEGWQTAGTTGSLQNLKRFNNQDFSHLRALCLSQGRLFEDDTFPAHISSIGASLLPEDQLQQIEWRRPTELRRNPCLIMDGVSRFDIIQGLIGDCWVLAALGSLTMQKRFLENCFTKGPRIPETANFFVFRLRGSYQNLHGGYISDALVDFTGGVQLQFSLKKPPPDLQEILKAAGKSRCMMGCSTSGQMRNTELRNGIVQGHAYTVTGAVKIRYKNGWEHIIRIWNPWGRGEWKGPWSDNSPEWNYVEPQIKEDLCIKKDDGEFWMSCEDFCEQFSWLCICNSTPTFLDFGDQCGMTWSVDRHIDLWSNSLSTGRNNSSLAGAVSKNPKYFFEVTSNAPQSYNVVISLMQKHAEGMQDAQTSRIGFSITKENSKVLKQDFSLTRDVTNYFTLSPGTYAVIPATTARQDFEFVLRIFLKNECYNENSDSQISPMLPTVVPRQNQDSSYKAIFLRYAKQGSSIDASQLRQLLNEVLLQDEMASLGGKFSFDSCRGILALMDTNANGRLTLQEFGSLWQKLTKYMDIFRREDKNNSGFLDIYELKSAIQTSGIKVLHLVSLRFGDVTRRIGFSDFMCCMLRLETMTYAFQNLANGGPQLFVTAMEVRLLVPSFQLHSGTMLAG
uniref:Calpain 13 n=2 Tax=Anas platyrhynchos TaxID=8839 RepID=A0A8B9TSZ4_ANAPL